MSTAKIFSHLMSRARPIIGADQQNQSAAHKKAIVSDEQPPSLAKRPSAATKRKTALTRVIGKNNRKKRQLTH